MVRITREGTVPIEFKATTVCKGLKKGNRGCGAQMEFVERDLKLVWWHGTHFKHYYAAVKCPACGVFTATKEIPQIVWERINTEKNKREATFDGHNDSIY